MENTESLKKEIKNTTRYQMILVIPGAYRHQKKKNLIGKQNTEKLTKKKHLKVYQMRIHTERANIKERSNTTAVVPHIDKLRIQLQTPALRRVRLQY